MVHGATAKGLINRSNPPRRPFVLSRAFFVGTQRYGAIWTGDNFAKWDHLAISTPMLLTIGISGLPFSGADVGGFFGNPEPELLVRWYQVGAFQPFFRAHAHIDTKRREPWLFGDPYTGYIRDIIRERYALLPLWDANNKVSCNIIYLCLLSLTSMSYCVLYIRPIFTVYPEEEETYAMDDQFFVGNSLLVKPIVNQGQTSTEVYFPGNEIYYDYFTLKKIHGTGKVQIEAPLNKIPVFLRGGSIVPKRQRIRRSSAAMRTDPFTLLIALDKNSEATGSLYLDDGETYDYEKGHFIHLQFNFAARTLTSESLSLLKNDKNLYAKSINSVRVERIIVLGLDVKPTNIFANCIEGTKFSKRELQFGFAATTSADVIIIKGTDLLITEEW
ncbi:8262_t:CDS:2, partial [Racocetra fulgida]